MIPGEVTGPDTPVEVNVGKPVTCCLVRNVGDRPIQVGSHYHFAEVNPSLELDRPAAWGKRLDIPAGTAVRFEPGLERSVTLVPLGGLRIVTGLRGLAGGELDGRPADGAPAPGTGVPADDLPGGERP
ncbi:MAG: urease subunit beta [Actinomycetota bacterium]|nr:urease subunit beta [Actinomycetota bacterium]